VGAAVALVITAGYWFTASTSFANPAITIARALSDTFAGIRMADVPAFIFGQLVGGLLASAFCAWLFAADRSNATAPLASDQRGR
jgi:glycerol uptake facilitator-like aquaporin